MTTDPLAAYHYDDEEVPLVRPDWAPEGDRLSDAWWAFHLAHPEVYAGLRYRALVLIERGYDHLGIKMLWEVLRYTTMLGARPDEDDYRLNNNHHSRYARLLMDNEAALRGVFSLRVMASDHS